MLFKPFDRVNALPLALFAVLCLIFSLVSLYLENQEQRRLASKARVVAQQVTNSIEVFSADRLRALEDLMITWPEYHPNHTDWFNSHAVTMHHVLPGFDDILWADENKLVQWNIKGQARSALLHQSLSDLGLHLERYDQVDFVSSLQGKEQGYYAWVARAINPYDDSYGYVAASFDIQATLSVMVGELIGPDFNFLMLDGEKPMMINGKLVDDEPVIEQKVSFAGRQWTLELQGNRGSLQIGRIVFGLGMLMSLMISIILQRQLRSAFKLSQSQERYQAASESSLDAILVLQAEHCDKGQVVDFRLLESNRMARRIFVHQDGCLQHKSLGEQLAALGHPELLQACIRVCETGAAYEQYLATPSELIRAQWIKIQVVRAGSGIAITVRDITARRQSEQALRESEEKFRRLVDGLNGHFIYSHDLAGNVSFVSHSVQDILGYSPAYFRQNYRRCVKRAPEDMEKIRRQLLQGKRPPPYVVEYYTREGQTKQIEYRDSPVFDTQRNLIAIEGIGRDVTADLALQQQVYHQANHDQLTGLYNRYAFDRLLKEQLARAREQGKPSVLCYIDMDQFKLVNDSCGHQAGDELLRQVANLLSGNLQSADILARVGGDEFCLVFADTQVSEVLPKLNDMLNAIRSFRFIWQDKVFHIGASIGVAEINARTLSSTELIKAADHACYSAKNLGRNRYHVFDATDQQLNYQQNELEWVNDIQKALLEDRFELFYQTIEPLNQPGEGLHYEILVRMLGKEGEYLNPGVFIPVAERYGLMSKLDEWVFNHTIGALEAHPEHLDRLGKCAINLSGVTLGSEEFLDKIVLRLRHSMVPPEKICFEVTETAAVTNLASASRFINTLRELGCRFALDDFGAGMCSFTYLKNMAVDYVKIDGSFVRNMCRDRCDYATVKAIHEIASSMGKLTVAEFVSDLETRQALLELGIGYGQGFALGKPAPLQVLLGNTPSLVQKLA
ncbi:putative bifunctional diguanylate cyclase/phosphodiesterase [Bowmanella dokdonensis]|uniref:EAL domain-containing protein n=1 Tax=Bowmanella dokdonensis TaxID=751969 RepID=A0A939DPI5_9ALTE|nr:EAL domain-containing protein [Bowmanella dokdonensis]MBN7825566.1 EAL domain-containing protein [Bowmanella dokdonensis]